MLLSLHPGMAPGELSMCLSQQSLPGSPGRGASGGNGLQIDAQPMPGLVPSSDYVVCCLEGAPSWWPS